MINKRSKSISLKAVLCKSYTSTKMAMLNCLGNGNLLLKFIMNFGDPIASFTPNVCDIKKYLLFLLKTDVVNRKTWSFILGF